MPKTTKIQKQLLGLSLFLFLFTTPITAQNQAKSKAYYFSAESSFNEKRYNDALELLQKSIEAGGGSNAYIESLKVQCYVAKKDWTNAKKALDKCYTYNPNNDILKKLSPIILKVDEQYEKAKEAARQKRIAEEKARQEKLRKQRELEAKQRELARKKVELSKKLEPEIRQKVAYFEQLADGKPYLLKDWKHITSSKEERAYLLFHYNEFVIYIVPNKSIVPELF